MVASSDDLCDVLQAGDESGSILDCRVRREVQRAVVCLGRLISDFQSADMEKSLP